MNESLKFDFSGESLSVKQEGGSKNLRSTPFPFDRYYHQFDKVMEEILYGNTFLINLTARSQVHTELSLDEIYQSTRAKYKIHLNTEEEKFVVFSPETFVKIENGHVFSYPMKGTMDASVPGAKEILLGDKKELAEHNTIIDLIRNDLSMVADQVTVTKYRYLDLIKSANKNLYQMSSEIRGRLPEDHLDRLGKILYTLLPAGSITGAPKKKTIEIIKATEGLPRGYYTGVAGVFDGEKFDSCVLIRFIEEKDGQKYYHSGGGITFQSAVEKEYQEMIDKIYLPN